MAFEIHERETEGVLILDLDGRLVAGDAAAALRERCKSLKSGSKVILNLKEVHFIDSSGLGTLVACHSTVEQGGGELKLLNLTERSAQLMVLTKLSTVFQIYEDEQMAVNSFFPDREVKRFDILEFVQSQENEEGQHLGSGDAKP
jgi:anti-sigma B factor antagonist